MLDEAIDTMDTATLGLFEILTTLEIYTLVNPFIHRHVTAGQTSIDPKEAVIAAVYGMAAQHRRLRLRVPGNPFNDQYLSVREKVMELLGNAALEKEKLTDEEKKEVRQAYEKIGKAAGEFVHMAADHLGIDMADVALASGTGTSD